MLKHLIALLTLLSLAACGGEPPTQTQESPSSLSEALTPVTVHMWMNPGTAVPTGNSITLHEDPARQTPPLIATTVLNLSGSSFYSPGPSTATAFDTADWATMKSIMGNCLATGNHMKIILTYDSSIGTTTHPLVANPGGVPRFVLCGSDPNCSL